MELQGFVVIGLTLILLGFLLPHLVRSRQLALDCRVEDRFSGDLRILTTGASRPVTVNRAGEPGQHFRPAARPFLHDPTRRPEAPMNRPGARSERTDDARALASARAARAARVARRAAAARRRLALTIVLLAATAAGWAGFATASTSWVLGAVPAALLVTVLVLGRRTAVKAAAHDKRDRAEMARLEARLRALPRRSGQPAVRSGEAGARPGQPAVVSGQPGARSGVQAGSRTAARTTGPVVARAGSSRVPAQDVVEDVEAGAAADRTGVPADVATVGDPATVSDVVTVAHVATVVVAGEAEQPADRTSAGTGAPVEPDDAEGEATVVDDPLHGQEAADDGRGESWTPVPLPAPSYTLKPSAPRRDVAPYAAPEPPVQTPAAAAQPAAPVVAGSPAALDLDAVLARRRAAGE
ncbi:hypothetical protein [Georgenia muralis]